ncbi:MAG TPA: S1 RNA-binding domain-containing protein [Planctomycetaceae bacterium]|nr:S1 RNA-binding domain-containing protein [Planctomycetaceae bacterium]
MSSDETRHQTAHTLQGAAAQPAAGVTQNAGTTHAESFAAADPHISEFASSIGVIEAVADTAIPDPERVGAAAPIETLAVPEQPLASATIVIDTGHVDLAPAPAESARSVSTTIARPAPDPVRVQPAAPSSAPGGESPPPPRPRVRLNPLVDQSQDRPRPTLGTPPAESTEAPPLESLATSGGSFEMAAPAEVPPASAPPAALDAAAAAEAALAATFLTATRVDLPPRQEELSPDLEAEIEAALASGQFASQPPPPPPPPLAALPAEQAAAEPAAEEAPAVIPSPERPAEDEVTQGTRLTGRVQSIHGDDVFLDLGYRAPGVVSLRQFEAGKQPEVGQQFQVTVDRVDPGEGLIHANLPRGRRRISGNWDAVSAGQTVDCMVTGVNKGGLEVTVSNLRGFLPASQVDLRFVNDLQQFVGQKLTVQVVEANPKKRNLVVSRRNHLLVEREEAEQNLWKTLALGQVFRGTVKTIKDYGAFIDIGGVDGFLHVGEMSWNRVRHPTDLLAEGQEVEVQVISLDAEKKRIGLGMKQLVADPWQLAVDKYAPGKTVSGRVTRTADFGAFVELEPGVEGLVHISELDYQRVRRVSDVVQEGQTLDVQVLEVIPDRKRISLSLKALKEKPAEARPPADEDLAPSGGEDYSRRRRGNLKGGTGSSSRGGLFGDPNRFS